MFEDSLFDQMPRIETDRLVLRKLEMRDAPDMFEYSRDPLVAKHVLWDAQTSVSESRGYIRYMLRKYRSGEPSSWGIEEKASGKIIGTIGYMWYQRENNSCEVGYSLARAHWGRGYMTEALKAVIAYSFKTLRIHRVEAQHETDNLASGRVMEKCGMTKEGTLRGRLYNKGKYVDVHVYSILREEYKK
ncbi:MAG: GNAT family N-acetyltransferase [Clostridia bacterium]|nr:GNAT family N-acetyltransferase [Clostridia bacterium]